MLIGADFKPFYPQDKGQDLGVKSWPPDAWKIGGGNMWGWVTYDPELDTSSTVGKSGPLESGTETRRQQVDDRRVRA